MTVGELYYWALQRAWGQGRRDRLDRHLQGYQVHFAGDLLCRVWAEVTNSAGRRGRKIDAADAWIAATALTLGIPLVTHNAADYVGVDGLTVLSAGPSP